MNIKTIIKRDDSAMMRASCIRRMDEIFAACDKVPISRILAIMMRTKGETQNDPYFWSDKTFLKKLEQYQDEFTSSYNPLTGEFDLNESYER